MKIFGDQNLNPQLAPMPSHTLKARQRCCKSTCLHCPYGHTVKKFGFEFFDLNDPLNVEHLKKTDLELYKAFVDFGPEAQNLGLTDFQLVTLKNHAMAIFWANHLQIKHIYFKESFRDQNIDTPLIEAYYF